MLSCCRPTLDQLTQIIKDAEAAGCSLPDPSKAGRGAAAAGLAGPTDPLLTAIAQQAAAARAWLDTAKTLTQNLKALSKAPATHHHHSHHHVWGGVRGSSRAMPSGGAALLSNPEVLAAVLQARNHLSLVPDLTVNVEKESEGLCEAAKAYCLCQSLYDEQRPMLGCDYCSDWYHWECVGLLPPREDQDDREVAPPDYRCGGGGGRDRVLVLRLHALPGGVCLCRPVTSIDQHLVPCGGDGAWKRRCEWTRMCQGAGI